MPPNKSRNMPRYCQQAQLPMPDGKGYCGPHNIKGQESGWLSALHTDWGRWQEMGTYVRQSSIVPSEFTYKTQIQNTNYEETQGGNHRAINPNNCVSMRLTLPPSQCLARWQQQQFCIYSRSLPESTRCLSPHLEGPQVLLGPQEHLPQAALWPWCSPSPTWSPASCLTPPSHPPLTARGLFRQCKGHITTLLGNFHWLIAGI